MYNIVYNKVYSILSKAVKSCQVCQKLSKVVISCH